MSLELTENKSSIDSGALDDLVFILYCRVIGQWLPTRRRSVGNQSAISWGAIGNRLAIGRRLVGDCILSVCLWLQKVCNFFWDRSATDRRLVGDQSATKNCVGIVCNRSNWSAISRQPVGDLSATCRRPPNTFLRSIWSQRGFTCSNQNLLATKSSLQPSKPVADQSPTSLQTPCNLSVTTRNFGRKEIADLLQAMCDRGLTQIAYSGSFWTQCRVWRDLFTYLTAGEATVQTFLPRQLTVDSRIQNCTYRKIITYQTPRWTWPILRTYRRHLRHCAFPYW